MNKITNIRSVLSAGIAMLDKLIKPKQFRIVTLCFHSFGGRSNRYSISVATFEKLVLKMLKTSSFIEPDKIKSVLSGEKAKENGVLITIDDGYKSVLKIKPIIKKYRIPVLLFVMSEPDQANRKEIGSNEKFLSWKDIRNLQNDGWVIGSHGARHSDFTNISTDLIQSEILNSKKAIEQKVGKKIKYFAYPKGKYDNRIILATKEAGFTNAFSIDSSEINENTNPYLIPRTIIDKTHLPQEIPAIYSRSWLAFRKLTNRFQLWEMLIK